MIAIKRCTCPPAAWRKCADDWYMPKLRHAGREYEPNVTRYAAVVLGKTITTATEADAVIVDVLRPAIRTGSYVSAKDTVRLALTAPTTPTAGATIADVLATFTADVVEADRSRTQDTRDHEHQQIARLAAFVPPGRRVAFGALPIAAPSDDDLVADLKAFKLYLAVKPNTWAKYRTVIGQFFRYAVAKHYRATDPLATLADHDRKALRRGKADTRRTRIEAADEAKLLHAALMFPPDPDDGERLHDLIVAAVDTGLRQGELVALQWADVDLGNRAIYVRAIELGAQKTGVGRRVPIFTRRLYDLLVTRKGAGRPRTDYVFGDRTGAKAPFAKRHWNGAVCLAHGHRAQFNWGSGHMTPATSAFYRRANWHFHDLRHEAGCRWLESKVFDLEAIRQLYGHATVAQTARYLHAEAGSAFAGMADYAAYLDRIARADQTAAAAALDLGPRGDKLGTNGKSGRRVAARPRLVKGGNS